MYGENIYDYIAIESFRVFCTIVFAPLFVIATISLFAIIYKRQVFLSERERIVNYIQEDLFDNYQKMVGKLLKKIEGKISAEIYNSWKEKLKEIKIGDFKGISALVSEMKFNDYVNGQEPLKKALVFLLIYLEHIIEQKNKSKFSNYYDLYLYQHSAHQKIVAGYEMACEIEKIEI